MAAVYAITIEQGATFQLNLLWKDGANAPINLTGYTARMQVRRKITDVSPLLNLTTENGGITLGGAAGTIAVVASATLTAPLPAKLCVYDLELVSPTGVVKRLLSGSAQVTAEVTR